jgi:uncharacterized protein
MIHVLVAGGSGFIGQAVVQSLISKGFQVTVFDVVTGPLHHENLRYYELDVRSGKLPTLSPCHAIINLAGASINHKLDDEYKKLIWSTRVISTRSLRQWVESQPWQPAIYIGASAVGFYGSRGSEVLTELSRSGSDFLAQTCIDWEREHTAFSKIGIDTVIFRQGHVMGQKGFLAEILPWYKRGFRLVLGSGAQYISWIDIRDLTGLYVRTVQGQLEAGIYNAVSNESYTFSALSRIIASYTRARFPLRVPEWIMSIRFGELAQFLLSSQNIVSSEKIRPFIHHGSLQETIESFAVGERAK